MDAEPKAYWHAIDQTPWEWDARARVAAARLAGARAIADLGCGTMVLERYLAPGQTYIPVDLAARDDRTLVVDFDLDPLPAIDADACALLGVLGYLKDPGSFLRAVGAAFPRTVTSYVAVPLTPKKRATGRCNLMSPKEIRALFAAADLRIVWQVRLPSGEELFDLRSSSQ
jgi:hypothetical protein